MVRILFFLEGMSQAGTFLGALSGLQAKVVRAVRAQVKLRKVRILGIQVIVVDLVQQDLLVSRQIEASSRLVSWGTLLETILDLDRSSSRSQLVLGSRAPAPPARDGAG
ncbi:hypothetical protein HAX54_018607 [Datura stramonium]|uniref:Secreted protein n=1 Tax=Datura stramonium TaxID=4076 RepID=A0ABS8UMQ0_DATST|nr:hypothetical protein [Datura stramonium]